MFGALVRCRRCASWIAATKPGQRLKKHFLHAKGSQSHLPCPQILKKELGKASSPRANVLLEEGCQLRVKSLSGRPCEIHEEGTFMDQCGQWFRVE